MSARGPGGPRAGPPPSTELLLQCQLDRRQAMSGDQVCENSFSATSRVKNIWNLERLPVLTSLVLVLHDDQPCRHNCRTFTVKFFIVYFLYTVLVRRVWLAL